MHHWIGNKLLLVAIVCGIASGAWGLKPSSARAYHTYKTRLLDTSAYSLHRRELRLGLMQLGYGIIDQLQVTTYTMPWFLGVILEDFAPNLELKSTFYDRRRLALSASVGVVEGQTTQVSGDGESLTTKKVRYLIVPLNLASSVRINSRVSTHLGAQFTGTRVLGSKQPTDNEIRGATAVNLLQLWGMFEWRLSRVTAFTLTVRWVPWASDTVVRGDLVVDPNTGAVLGLEVEVFDLTNAFAIIPGFVFSWKRANLRVGAGYGDFFLEGLGLLIPGSTLRNISPELDVFVRF